jgi:hypothetical protein
MVNYYKTIIDYSTAVGAMPLLYAIRDGIPFAYSGLLLAIFIALTAGQYYLAEARTGRAKILTALLTSSFVCLLLSLLLALAQLTTFLTVLFYAFLTIVWFVVIQISDNY